MSSREEETGRKDSGEGDSRCRGSESPLFRVRCSIISTAGTSWPMRMEDGPYPS